MESLSVVDNVLSINGDPDKNEAVLFFKNNIRIFKHNTNVDLFFQHYGIDHDLILNIFNDVIYNNLDTIINQINEFNGWKKTFENYPSISQIFQNKINELSPEDDLQFDQIEDIMTLESASQHKCTNIYTGKGANLRKIVSAVVLDELCSRELKSIGTNHSITTEKTLESNNLYPYIQTYDIMVKFNDGKAFEPTKKKINDILANPKLAVPELKIKKKESTSSKSKSKKTAEPTPPPIINQPDDIMTDLVKIFPSWKDLKLKTLQDNLLKVLTLSNKDKICVEQIRKKMAEAKPISNGIVFDPWQAQMIEKIVAGESVLANTPTSSGKTFIALHAFGQIFASHNKSIAYVGPNFHLVLQFFCDIMATFPEKNCSLITNNCSYIPSNATIWIGTPNELLAYFNSNQIGFDIGVFDEIHSISTSFSEPTHTNIIRCEAMDALLKLCRTQMVALSATINPDDIPILTNHLNESVGAEAKNIQNISYTHRHITTQNYYFDGNSIHFMDPADTSPLNIQRDITHQSTFELLSLIKKSKMYPAVIFDRSEEKSYVNFKEYIDYLDQIMLTDFSEWNRLHAKYEADISEFNSNAAGLNQINNPTAQNQADIDSANYRRQQLVTSIDNSISSLIIKYLHNHSINPSAYSTAITPEIQQSFIFTELSGTTIPLICLDLMLEKGKLGRNSSSGNVSDIRHICSTVPSFLTMDIVPGTNNNSSTLFNSLYSNGRLNSTMANMKARIQSFLNAEKISEANVKEIFKLISRGLRYGVGIILPTMPFCVQFEMLSLLKSKNINCVFASHSMSMGINLPIRTVVIRSEDIHDINVCEYLQMAGRAGRRGLDREAYAISWNIHNARSATQSHLPRIQFPVPRETNYGYIINNYIDVAVSIDVALSRIGKISKDLFDMVFKKLNFENVKINLSDALVKNAVSEHLISTLRYLPNYDWTIVDRIINLIVNDLLEDYLVDTYYHAQLINNFKYSIQELQIRLHRCQNIGLLAFLEKIYILLHKIQYRQMELIRI